MFHFLTVLGISYLFIRLILKSRKKRYLYMIISLNLLNLFFFKYVNSVLFYFAQWGGWAEALALKKELGILLPLAISFYTFQIIAFIVDVWRGEIREVSYVRFNLFILFFPQLIAGPIMRHRDFYEQMDHPVIDPEHNYSGIALILQGVLKKVIIADQLGYLIAPVWSNPADYNGLSIFTAVVGFSMQVYGDFSGYTDMARGFAYLLGYKIPDNFFSPFLSLSFGDLWRRWHVTLATWLRDYLYIPLGGNRVAMWRNYVNLIVVMTLGGVWHGDTYNFFFWGLIHGVFLSVERFFKLDLVKGEKAGWGEVTVRWLIVITGWMIGATFFRAADLTTVITFAKGLFSSQGKSVEKLGYVYQLAASGMLIQIFQYYFPGLRQRLEVHAKWFLPVAAVLVFFVSIRIQKPATTFIYFQF